MMLCIDCGYYEPELEKTKCTRCIWVVCFSRIWSNIGRIMNADADGCFQCDCSGAGKCSARCCVVCCGYDCKYPGACWGKCQECGEQARPNALLGPHYYDLYCSDKCSQESWNRAEREGRVFYTGEMTPERLNELFNQVGLGLSGVGPVNAS